MSDLFRKLIVFLLTILIIGLGAPLTVAAQSSSYNSGKLMDDAVFDNQNSMSAAQIDSFLNSFTGSCISLNSGFTASEPIGYNPTQGFMYGFKLSTSLRREVIYDAAQAYEINPQLLISMIEMQQGLVDGHRQRLTAMKSPPPRVMDVLVVLPIIIPDLIYIREMEYR